MQHATCSINLNEDLLMHARDKSNKAKTERQEIMIHATLGLIRSIQMNRFKNSFTF